MIRGSGNFVHEAHEPTLTTDGSGAYAAVLEGMPVLQRLTIMNTRPYNQPGSRWRKCPHRKTWRLELAPDPITPVAGEQLDTQASCCMSI
jgi:hypothetical protein